MNVLNNLNPQKVFSFFEEISAIPRGSGHNDKIREYCENFAKQRNLKYVSDKAGNVIIYKSASKDSNSTEPVILQGHLDMVWQKDSSSNINFKTDGLELRVDGDFISANGTTLGGDDGIAVAMCLAILDSDDICHPPLEIVLTADEEIGMLGAFALDFDALSAKRMINLDSEAEGTLWVSCAGGVRADIKLPVNYVRNDKPTYKITVTGLHGGHSGAEIHKGYANANKVMGRVLSFLYFMTDFEIFGINGGTADNAITRECECIIKTDCPDLKSNITRIYEEIKNDYTATDPDFTILCTEFEKFEGSMDLVSTVAVVNLLNKLPSGVIAMSKDIEGFVETSLNLGILETLNYNVSYSFALRSGVDSEKDKLAQRIADIAKEFNAEIRLYSDYPAWEYKKDSILRDKMAEIYKEMFGREMTVTAIHAGLECGLFSGKIKGLDCVSLGPDMYDIHTPSERLSISSTERVWNFLLRVLESI